MSKWNIKEIYFIFKNFNISVLNSWFKLIENDF